MVKCLFYLQLMVANLILQQLSFGYYAYQAQNNPNLNRALILLNSISGFYSTS